MFVNEKKRLERKQVVAPGAHASFGQVLVGKGVTRWSDRKAAANAAGDAAGRNSSRFSATKARNASMMIPLSVSAGKPPAMEECGAPDMGRTPHAMPPKVDLVRVMNLMEV